LTQWYSSTHWRLSLIEKEAGKMEAVYHGLKAANIHLDKAKTYLLPKFHYSYASEDVFIT